MGNDVLYTVEVLGPKGNVVFSTEIIGPMAASEYLEKQLQHFPNNYWGHISICNTMEITGL